MATPQQPPVRAVERVEVESLDGNRVAASNGETKVVLDLPRSEGGEGRGLGPFETLLSALGACTSMTLLGYARRKGWPLEGVSLTLSRDPGSAPPGIQPPVEVEVRLRGPLADDQRARLLEIANKCPVNRALTAGVRIVERLG